MSVGVIVGVRGIVGKELRSRTRGYWRPMLLLTIYLTLLTVAVLAGVGFSVSNSGTVSPNLGQVLFATLAAGSVLLIAFIAPALTAGTISGERERRTLDLLLVTRASPLGLVTGKLLGALLWVLYLLFASLPALGIVNLFGGAALLTALATLSVIAATALTYCALGLLMSALFRRTVLATVLAYAGVLVTVVVVPIVGAYISAYGPGGYAIAQGGTISFASSSQPSPAFGVPPGMALLTFASPLTALLSVLGLPLGPVFRGGVSAASLLNVYVMRIGAQGEPVDVVTSFAPWVFFILLSILWSVFALLLAAVVLRPVPFWQRRRLSRGR